ncbi:unnamed protein product, partial [Didymodactylos carnosus]
KKLILRREDEIKCIIDNYAGYYEEYGRFSSLNQCFQTTLSKFYISKVRFSDIFNIV